MGEVFFDATGAVKPSITVTWSGRFLNVGNVPTPDKAESQIWLFAGGSEVANIVGPTLPAIPPGGSYPFSLSITYVPPLVGFTGQLSARVQVLGSHVDGELAAKIVPGIGGPKYSLGQTLTYIGPTGFVYPAGFVGTVKSISQWTFDQQLGLSGIYFVYEVWEGWGGMSYNIPEPYVASV